MAEGRYHCSLRKGFRPVVMFLGFEQTAERWLTELQTQRNSFAIIEIEVKVYQRSVRSLLRTGKKAVNN